MVGEIRNSETAQIAIRAALTGHLVFSTLHTNSAWDAITRLADMGLEPYLLAASLRLVVAQRLLRLLCSHCKTASTEALFPDVQADLAIDQHWVPVGCPACFYTGSRGRRAAFEVLPISRDLTDMIKPGQGNIDAYLLEAGIPRLRDTLTDWLREGWVSLEEVIGHLEG